MKQPTFIQNAIMKIIVSICSLLLLFSCKENTLEEPVVTKVNMEQGSYDLKKFIGKDFLIDDQHSYLGFKIKYFGFSPVRGRFDQFDGTLFYNAENISALSTSVMVDVGSINTGNKRRDNDLISEGSWFDGARFPNLRFTSDGIIPRTDGSFDLIGYLTIKGVTLVDTIAFDAPTRITKDWAGNDQVDFHGSVTINRQDYGVFGGDFWSSIMENGLAQLSDEVEIEIEMHCRKADYEVRYETADSMDINKRILDIIRLQGIDAGINAIADLHNEGNLTSGKLSSIGYTLNTWGMHEQALVIFNKRLDLFPDVNSTWNQLGITHLFLEQKDQAQHSFERALELDSNDSRALEYIRLIKKI